MQEQQGVKKKGSWESVSTSGAATDGRRPGLQRERRQQATLQLLNCTSKENKQSKIYTSELQQDKHATTCQTLQSTSMHGGRTTRSPHVPCRAATRRHVDDGGTMTTPHLLSYRSTTSSTRNRNNIERVLYWTYGFQSCYKTLIFSSCVLSCLTCLFVVLEYMGERGYWTKKQNQSTNGPKSSFHPEKKQLHVRGCKNAQRRYKTASSIRQQLSILAAKSLNFASKRPL